MLLLIPLTASLHRLESAYQFSSNKEKLMDEFMDELKLYVKNEKGLK